MSAENDGIALLEDGLNDVKLVTSEPYRTLRSEAFLQCMRLEKRKMESQWSHDNWQPMSGYIQRQRNFRELCMTKCTVRLTVYRHTVDCTAS